MEIKVTNIISFFVFTLCLIGFMSCQTGDGDGGTTTSEEEEKESFITPSAEAGSGALSISSQISVVEAQGDSGVSGSSAGSQSLQLNSMAIQSVVSQAINTGGFTADSDYNKDKTQTWVHEESVQAFNTVNEILCSIDQSKYAEMKGKGYYRAQIDTSQCSSESDDASTAGKNSQNQSSSNSKTEYENWTVHSSRVTDQPHIVKVWVEETARDADDEDKLIMAKMEIYRSSTEENPLGFFKLNFIGYPVDASGDADLSRNPFFKGFMRTVKSTTNGDILLQFSNSGDFGGGKTFKEQATFRRAASGDAGSGTMKSPVHDGGSSPTEETFNIAYDSTSFLRQKAGETAQCFARNSFEETAWSYGMYDNTGSRVELDSGFPIKFNDGSEDFYGWVGYHGLWMPDDASISNGDTVTKQDYNDGSSTETDYVVFISGGRLVKHTKKSMTLGDLKNIPLQWYDSGTNYQVKWTGSELQKVATLDDSNWTWQEITPETLDVSGDWGFGFWSDALGGSGSFSVKDPSDGSYIAPSNSTAVNFRVQDIVYPTDTIPGTLLCFENCPDATAVANPNSSTLTKTDKNWYENGVAPSAFTYHSYTFDSVNMVLKDGGFNVVMSEENENFDWGVHSGILFEGTAGNFNELECDYEAGSTCNYQGWESLDVFYTWETGPENWNKFTAIKLAGVFERFDPPMKVRYTHSQSDSSAYDYKYDGVKFNLEYAGFGNLHGIPGKCIDRVTGNAVSCNSDTRWVPEFNIEAGSTVIDISDGITEYVVKPLKVEQRMSNVSLSQCAGLSLTTYSLPGLEDWVDPNIGSKPVVTDPPAVIGGVLQ